MPKQDEKILVVPAQKLFPQGRPQGFRSGNFESYQDLITREQKFIWRSKAETDPTYKQIIPYLIFHHGKNLFLMQRKTTASEQRLSSKYSLGIGGHIREEDLGKGASLIAWAKREFEEEVNYNGNLKIKPLGLLNDDSNEVGKVHVGFAFLLSGDTDQIKIRDEHFSGELVSLEMCADYADRMETWSSCIFDYIKHHQDLLK